MKVLQFPAYITIDGNKKFSRSTTGYGYMTSDIATSLAQQKIEVDLLTQSNITKGLDYKGVNILKRTWYNIFSNFKFLHLFSAFKIILKDKISFKKIPNIVLYYISMGYFEKLLKSNDYDLVHIHGIGYYTIPIIETCKKSKVKYIVTLHGLNSFSDSINVTKREKEIEKDFLKSAEANQISVTVISTGIRNTILQYLKKSNSDNFTVVTNGCNTKIKDSPTKIDIRKKHGIQDDVKIMLCVGNIGNNKNQIQIVRAFSKLPDSAKKQLSILFLGGDMTNGTFANSINNIELSSSLIYCGNISKNDLSAFYSKVDYNIVASISEGFGLSIIEGFVHGLPCLTFDDLDAVPDLYHENAMLLVTERADNSLAEGISKMLSEDWDKNKIKKHAQQFSLENMAQHYFDIYYKLSNTFETGSSKR